MLPAIKGLSIFLCRLVTAVTQASSAAVIGADVAVLAAVLGPGEVAVWPAQPLASIASITVTAKRKARGLKRLT